jgi:hypothetical protein
VYRFHNDTLVSKMNERKLSPRHSLGVCISIIPWMFESNYAHEVLRLMCIRIIHFQQFIEGCHRFFNLSLETASAMLFFSGLKGC